MKVSRYASEYDVTFLVMEPETNISTQYYLHNWYSTWRKVMCKWRWIETILKIRVSKLTHNRFNCDDHNVKQLLNIGTPQAYPTILKVKRLIKVNLMTLKPLIRMQVWVFKINHILLRGF